jgi:hypothetical protein
MRPSTSGRYCWLRVTPAAKKSSAGAEARTAPDCRPLPRRSRAAGARPRSQRERPRRRGSGSG